MHIKLSMSRDMCQQSDLLSNKSADTAATNNTHLSNPVAATWKGRGETRRDSHRLEELDVLETHQIGQTSLFRRSWMNERP